MTSRERQKPGREACFAERRGNHRLAVQLDIVVRLRTAPGTSSAVEKATTHNVSPGDMYFHSSLGDRMHVGDVLDVDIELPAPGTIFGERHLTGKGRVVRLSPCTTEEPNRRGVAIVFLEPPAFRRVLG